MSIIAYQPVFMPTSLNNAKALLFAAGTPAHFRTAADRIEPAMQSRDAQVARNGVQA
jgi:hypothetical protein